jgi:hypothetical protein
LTVGLVQSRSHLKLTCSRHDIHVHVTEKNAELALNNNH